VATAATQPLCWSVSDNDHILTRLPGHWTLDEALVHAKEQRGDADPDISSFDYLVNKRPRLTLE
jgi:hypothetical protein